MANIIQRNVELCGFQEKSHILMADFFEFNRWVPKVKSPKIVFLDPPFLISPVEVLEKLYNLSEIVKNSLIVIRFSKRQSPFPECSFFRVAVSRIYGDSVLMFGSFE